MEMVPYEQLGRIRRFLVNVFYGREFYEGEVERVEERRKAWQHHIQHEMPHSSDQINYGFVKRDFVEACCKSLEDKTE